MKVVRRINFLSMAGLGTFLSIGCSGLFLSLSTPSNNFFEFFGYLVASIGCGFGLSYFFHFIFADLEVEK